MSHLSNKKLHNTQLWFSVNSVYVESGLAFICLAWTSSAHKFFSYERTLVIPEARDGRVVSFRGYQQNFHEKFQEKEERNLALDQDQEELHC